ncbi:pyridoxamine 5'-phosphate oxidase family protein [Kribbella sp. NPDC051952]|uniref:pyridoxamine 5'-phosphate oxidase family protein n=1 Tax=Kribbella sp. NPDC051952 TaxID=3154851 RepID=UPI00343DBD39
MGTVFPDLNEDLLAWIGRQPMFFVGTAPSGDGGHVNISPKGGEGTLQVLGPKQLAYVDLFGSGIETVAHLKQNGRIVVMFCAFSGAPKTLRVHGRGEVLEQADPRFAEVFAHFSLADEMLPTVRSIIRIDVERVADSCGYGVPEMTMKAERKALYKTAAGWIRQRGDDAIERYCDVNNGESIDGIAGLTPFGSAVDDESRYTHEGRRL